MSTSLRKIGLFLIACFIGAPAVSSGVWPAHTITLVVPYPAGGSTDMAGRIVADGLAKELGVSVVVENRTGASGNIAGRSVARSKPDGYTLLFATGAQSINMAIFSEPGYDLVNDFRVVATIDEGPMVLLSNSQLPFNTLRGLLEYARTSPRGLQYSSAGNGTSSHLTMEIFSQRADINMQHIPYTGAAPSLNALLGGHVDLKFDALSTLSHVKDGKLNALGVSSAERSPIAPNIPTITEQGIPALDGFNEVFWNAVLVPINTETAVIDSLSEALSKVLTSEAVQQRFYDMGNKVTWRNPEESQKYVETKVTQWRERIPKINVTLN